MAKCYAVGANLPGFLPAEVAYYGNLDDAVDAFLSEVKELDLDIEPIDREEVRKALGLWGAFAVSAYARNAYAEYEVWISEVSEEAECEDYPGFVG